MLEHKPVLLKESLDYLKCKENGIYIDATLGRGGHTEEIIKAINDRGLVIGIDRDHEAIESVKKRLKKYSSLRTVHDNFTNIPFILEQFNIKAVDGMLFDLGVSSPQFDNPERGFSYRKEGPLDMRMDKNQELTAEYIVNNFSHEELTNIFKEYGEERWASRIANFIIKSRQHKPIKTTLQLTTIIKDAIPASARRKGGHPARRTFQALRIATNDELNILKKTINHVVKFLKPGGRICIISFHSLEDRIVKKTFRELARDCVCPPDFPECVCDHKRKLKIITKKPVKPGENEVENNPRARSARLRVAERVLN
ncbi:16S rRNA (cytosine(1402)-N(4))-methyltransferase RsmH [Halothermothrix orenii]|uniref:Ribosomal RNA small subunit methyltransferase H n=1 Tax=Halothermothrix orenii (strain H 168 / OCM 544 / DSM 9562) TaxID=373903 RepID=RSMH_HALOH|nr:16S rRNA (cytosine(1402)-N(4))-methyltransferase RsmH [Halothermothrix orenii]B8CWI8.1 RecName: Full=Ribosomal RNA small subunit methyltransferase H; AltName: Full=16S rRNA m(4)C1402 methyltransferase; AltName: Full=rRNA (cytosine-N(4)-)-methyltransferase RsmH [Halothermothrix orenii H 168]ACL69657.1 S-adenosyl-methyltransferase MraW [Halothermothrix orenii H 168]